MMYADEQREIAIAEGLVREPNSRKREQRAREEAERGES